MSGSMLIRSAPDSGPRSPELHRRLRWLVLVVLVASLILVGRLWQLQIVRGERYFEAARSNVVAERFLPSVRGKILDRNHRPLADNRPAFNIYLTPAIFGDDSRLSALAGLLDLSDEELALVRERLQTGRARAPGQAVLVLEDQGRDRAALVAQARLEIPGVEVRDEPYRYYPNGALAAHLLGYMNQLTPRELAELESEGYKPSEYIGRAGLEREWENYLRGKKGIERYVVNAKGERIEDAEAEKLIEGPRFVPPVAGHNVVLTIDLELQRIVERSVRLHSAAAVAVIEVDTGRVLALSSTPAFDPNVMTGHLTASELARLMNDPRKPFIDKTLRQHYPPGSTFKFVVGAAGLENGVVDLQEPLTCPGYHQQGRRVFRCTGDHGKVSLVQAIQHSCNVYFWKLAERVGIDRMAELAFDFGFGAPTGIGLNGDVPGRIPTRAWYEERDTFKIGYTLNAAIGQGDVAVTVLQLAMAYAAIANGGDLYVPQVVDRVETASGEVAVTYEPVLRRHLSVSGATLDAIRRGMWMVVNTPGGTANSYGHSDVVEYAGKTGTSQVRSTRRRDHGDVSDWDPRRDHAWFAGFAPADDPQIALVVLIEHGGAGGKVAGPVAKEIVDGYFTQIAPRPTGEDEP